MSKLVSAQLEHGKHEEALANHAHRIIAGILWLIVMVSQSGAFIAFGWLAVQCTLHVPRLEVYLLMAAATIQFVFAIYALFKGLDDLFYQKDDRRRLTRRSIDR